MQKTRTKIMTDIRSDEICQLKFLSSTKVKTPKFDTLSEDKILQPYTFLKIYGPTLY